MGEDAPEDIHLWMDGWMVYNRIAKYLFRHNSKQYDEVMKK